MFERHRSTSMQFPRQKIFLSSLTHLIDRKLVVQPEAQVSSKLFPQRDFAKKLSISHQRVKSSVQLRSRKFDLRWSSKNAKNLVVENNRSPTHHQPFRQKAVDPAPYRSAQLSANPRQAEGREEPLLRISQTYSAGLGEGYMEGGRCESPQRNFLRKGSNLQKQIVINLLRSKLMRERELNERKEYSNQEIIKMIQVFKGVTLAEGQGGRGRKGVVDEGEERERVRQEGMEHMKDIKGWEQEEVQEVEEK